MKSKLKSSSFTKNVITLLTGTVVAQALPIAVMPILARLYSPADFGILATFVAITSILGVIANGRYDLAIILPEKDEDAVNIVALGLLIAFFLSILCFIFILVLHNQILELISLEAGVWWLYLIPFSLLFSGLYNVLSYYNIRIKSYKDISISNVYKGVVLSSVQMLLGFLALSNVGLILGQFLSQVSSNLKLIKNFWNQKNNINFYSIKQNAIRYMDFPKYSLWGVISNTLSVNIVSLVIPILYGFTTLGFYSVIYKFLGMPITLIGTSISQVYYQAANKEKEEKNNCIDIFEKTFKKLLVVSCIVFIPLYFLSEFVFHIFLGDGWKGVYVYAQILIPMFAIRFIATSLSNTTNIFEKQKLAFFCQVVLLILTLIIIGFVFFYALDIYQFLKILSVCLSIYYSFQLYVLYRVARGNT